MLLAVDIGNTNIVFGIYSDGNWKHHWRIQTVHKRMPDEYAVLFRELLREADLGFDHFDQAIIGSVVPQLTRGIRDMIASRSASPPLIVSTNIDTAIEIRTDHPDRVGSDLIADAVAAYDRFQSDCIVVDFGTATTVTAVSKPGVLLGTAIGAGLNVTIDALVNSTAQLPHIELAPPPSVIGKNTVHSMQSGLVLGYVCMIEGLLDRMKKELNDAKVVATGGLSSIIAPLTDRFDLIDPWLTLDGLRLIAENNR